MEGCGVVCACGSVTVNRMWLSALAAQMAPPCRRTISFAIASPRPAPPFAVEREESRRKNCSKMRSSFSFGMVLPLFSKRSVISPWLTWPLM